MIDKDLDIEIFRIEVRQKGNGLPRVYVYDKGNPISVESIEFTAKDLDIPRVVITKPILNVDEHIENYFKNKDKNDD
jgi:hypothetical protein